MKRNSVIYIIKPRSDLFRLLLNIQETANVDPEILRDAFEHAAKVNEYSKCGAC